MQFLSPSIQAHDLHFLLSPIVLKEHSLHFLNALYGNQSVKTQPYMATLGLNEEVPKSGKKTLFTERIRVRSHPVYVFGADQCRYSVSNVFARMISLCMPPGGAIE
jgi:hypothetical protein